MLYFRYLILYYVPFGISNSLGADDRMDCLLRCYLLCLVFGIMAQFLPVAMLKDVAGLRDGKCCE